MQILLIRHARDLEGYLGGWSQHDLTDEGHAEALELAESLRNSAFPPEKVISSDLPRAWQTARHIAQGLRLPLEPDPAWREVNNGDLAGLSHAEAQQRYPGIYFAALRMNQSYPNGESPLEFQARIRSAWSVLTARIEAHALPSCVAVVTHGGVISVLLHQLSRLEWTSRSVWLVPNASVTEVRWLEGSWTVPQIPSI